MVTFDLVPMSLHLTPFGHFCFPNGTVTQTGKVFSELRLAIYVDDSDEAAQTRADSAGRTGFELRFALHDLIATFGCVKLQEYGCFLAGSN